jgi:uncharacterized protein (DUF1778 family)
MPKQPKPKKMGRPVLPKGEAKGAVIHVRVSADEAKAMTKAAKAKTLSLSAWVREAANAAL